MATFSESDHKQLSSKGINQDSIINQINRFKTGFPFINLKSSATLQKGIKSFDRNGLTDIIEFYEENKHYYDIIKFVPASGAASRMFKSLYSFVEEYDGKQIPANFVDRNSKFDSASYFFANIKSFPFYSELADTLCNNGMNIEKLLETNDLVTIAKALLNKDGMNYGNLPKALLKFHTYDDSVRIAIEEHLVEAANYAVNDRKAQLHFTLSPEHKELFEKAIEKLVPQYEKRFGIGYSISYSEQKQSTDTVAVDLNNELFRNADGSILFRPAGHGALIENLNDLKKEIIYIKNIDNIVPDKFKQTTFDYKKAIGGYLMKLQQKTFDYLFVLDDGDVTDAELGEMTEFAEKELMIEVPDYFEAYSNIEKIDWLYNKFNRPMRVCGMVRNEGEPGGGPYYTVDDNDEESLQIVESSQINHADAKQEAIFRASTHFNPVDLVCATYDFTGTPFNLTDYVDRNTGFISQKSKDGRNLKALELPGLWNGAMADWITVFVEVPIETFNPVKTVNDLLRPMHQ